MTWLAAVAAVAASLLQAAFLHTAVTAATPATQDITATWFHAVNVTDMITLVLLGTVVGGLTIMLMRAGAGPWFSWPALGLAALLLAGLAFISAAPVLGGMLAASLVLLLSWALVVAVLTVRLSEPAGGPVAVVDSRRGMR